MKTVLRKNNIDLTSTPDLPGEVLDFAVSPLRGLKKEPQYLDIKQMGEIVQRFRARMKLSIQGFRRWKTSYAREKDEIEKAYMALEGICLRRQLGDAWMLYVKANRDYHAMRRGYLANLRQPPHYSRGAA